MANNNAIYNAVLSGAGAGVESSRWLTKTNQSDYNDVAITVNQFALQVDHGIAAGTVSEAEAALMQSICQSVMNSRLPLGTSQNDYVGLAASVTALYNRLRSLLLPVANPANLVSPVYVESYLAAAGNDIRTAITNAWLANPNASEFIYPAGSWNFVGTALTLADGFRNNVIHTGQNTELYRDVGGVATGQQIFFLRTETGATRAQNISFRGFKFTLTNCLTSFFGYAIGLISATNCTVTDCEFYCTLAVGVTTGKIRWGFALFGGTGADGGGRNNIVKRIRMTLCQIQLCAGPNDVDGILCTDIESTSNNDYILSCVSSPGGSVRNVTIANIVGHDVAGSGCVFLGSDGAGTAIGADNVENITCTNVSVDGAKNPDLDFNTASIVLIDLGVRSRNIIVNGINTTLTSTELQSRSLTIASQDDEVSSQGVCVANINGGIVTTNDPLEALFIQGHNLDRLQITNVSVEGLRGIRIIDCDQVSMSNCSTKDGGLLMQAETRNLTRIDISNCHFIRATGFNTAMAFQSAASKSFGTINLSNLTMQDNNGASGGLFLSTGAAAGTSKFNVVNLAWLNGTSPPNAATLAAIFRAVNCPGLSLITTVNVVVPAVVAGDTRNVDVSLAGTRMSDVAVNEVTVVSPQADVMPAGAGGGLLYWRVTSTGTIRLWFGGGTVTGGAINFSFGRAAA